MQRLVAGDIVVLLRDGPSNYVTRFERFIGAVGEVILGSSRPRVKFGDEQGETWYYDANQLFKLGSVESEV